MKVTIIIKGKTHPVYGQVILIKDILKEIDKFTPITEIEVIL